MTQNDISRIFGNIFEIFWLHGHKFRKIRNFLNILRKDFREILFCVKVKLVIEVMQFPLEYLVILVVGSFYNNFTINIVLFVVNFDNLVRFNFQFL